MGKNKRTKSGKIAIIVSRFNEKVSGGLLSGALSYLKEIEFEEKNISVFYCPGAFEIPLTAKHLCQTGKYCGIICLGAVIKGETAHFEYISEAVTSGLVQLNLEFGIPLTFGVLTSYTEEQAIERSSDGPHNKGREAASAAVEMIKLLKEI